MKILIYLAVWQRPEITEICFMGINRLRKNRIHQVDAFAVISEESMIPLCEKYSIDFTMFENSPLGAKKNHGLKCALEKEFDYLVEIGSDDLLKDEFFDVYPWDRSIMTLESLVFLNSKDGDCSKISGVTIGTGRAIRRDVLEKTGDLWRDDLNKGLDNNSIMNMAGVGFGEKRFRTSEPVAIDIKSDVNIWPYESIVGEPYSFDKAVEGLSYQEIEAIKSLQYASVKV